MPEQQRVARWLSYVPYFQAHIAVRLENQEGNGQMDAGWMLPDAGWPKMAVPSGSCPDLPETDKW